MGEPGARSSTTHVAFADESNWNAGRYRSICLVSAPRDAAVRLHHRIGGLICQSGRPELKWSRVRSAATRDAASHVISLSIDAIIDGSLRVDVLSWDVSDSRHSIPGRDDSANLQRMYFHLLRRVMTDSWPDGARWGVYPDEQGTMDWNSLEEFLDRRSDRWEIVEDVAGSESGRTRYRDLFRIEKLVPSQSHEFPLIQVADLFAGLSVYSRNRHDAYQRWLKRRATEQPTTGPDEQRVSRADKHRFQVIELLDRKCKENDLGVSLRRYGGFRSFLPSNPIDFWWWEPQGSYDKAPTRG